MRVLLDTHAFYWWTTGDQSLSLSARAVISDKQNEVYISAASVWEVVMKFRSGKEPGFADLAANMADEIAAQGFIELAVTLRHAEITSKLPFHHKDPMDRFIIGQAIVEDMTIVTIDPQFSKYA